MSDLDILYKRREYLNTRIKDTRMELLRSKNEFKRLCEKFKGIVQVFKLQKIQNEFKMNKLGGTQNLFKGNLSFGRTENILSQFAVQETKRESLKKKEHKEDPSRQENEIKMTPKNPFESSFENSIDSFFKTKTSGQNKKPSDLEMIFMEGNRQLKPQQSNPFDEQEKPEELVFYQHSTDSLRFN